MLSIDILTLFPEYFESPFEQSVMRRAKDRELIRIRSINVRTFASGKHRKVDDRPYGGGPGMVMMPGPLCDAIRSVKGENSHVIYLTPQGKVLTASDCERLAKYPHLILICGHYEGIDQRVIEKEVDEEISIGNYVLTHGGPAAIVLVDAVSRFIPGVLGNEQSALQDSFQKKGFKGPQYTRPETYEGISVPEELKSGHHVRIQKWREEQGLMKEKSYESQSGD
jgi:tRNA (guanine37-N1)-methyltransferase